MKKAEQNPIKNTHKKRSILIISQTMKKSRNFVKLSRKTFHFSNQNLIFSNSKEKNHKKTFSEIFSRFFRVTTFSLHNSAWFCLEIGTFSFGFSYFVLFPLNNDIIGIFLGKQADRPSLNLRAQRLEAREKTANHRAHSSLFNWTFL